MTHETGIAPAILRLYPGLDAGQRELIRRLEGPVLGIAGPGAGKTLSVALRAANVLLLGKAEPRELLRSANFTAVGVPDVAVCTLVSRVKHDPQSLLPH